MTDRKRKFETVYLPGETKRFKTEDIEDIRYSFDDFKHSWERKSSSINSKTDDLIFQQLDIDYSMGDPIEGMPGSHIGKIPIIRLYGLTNEGNSVLLLVHGVIPYFFVEAPNGFKESDCELFKQCLNKQMHLAPLQGIHVKYENYIIDTELVYKQSIMGYSGSEKVPFIKISMAAPMLVPSARRLLEGGYVLWNDVCLNMLTYESNIQFVLRYMIDKDIVGASWIKCKANTYSIINDESKKLSRCQIEAVIGYDKLISLGAIGEWDKLAPLRILSFDIECCSAAKGFPDPTIPGDQVIQIANYVAVQGQKKPLVKVIFNLGGCSPIVGAQILCYNNESDLITEWGRFIQIIDPDFIIGYNIANFDFWYIITRAQVLKSCSSLSLSRLKSDKTKIKNEVFSSKAYGRRESKTCALPGRVQFDIYQVIQRDYKLRSYSLNSVSAHFLGQQKEDVQYNIIGTLFRGSDNDRKRLAVYCLKDAELPYLLLDKLMMLVNYIEMARVTGVPVSYLLTRGQQIKVLSQLYRKALERGLLIPTVTVKPQGDDVAYTGAIVIDPITGYYDKPISTLDFNSLYPTIMIAHNLCYTTLLTPQDIKKLSSDDYSISPNGDYFVKPHIQKGILPEILEELLAARKKAKRALAEETDPFKAAVQNGRQLALKVSANSVYGFTGALRGKLPCLSISASTTSYGREMIDLTKELVEAKYKIENGYQHDAVVVYGDSVTKDTTIITKTNDNKIDIKEIQELWCKENSIITHNKEYCSIDNIMIHTEKGFTKIKNIVRHKTRKEIFKIITNTSSVKVTQDHSLLDEYSNPIKPIHLKKHSKLLHWNKLQYQTSTTSIPLAKTLGFFFGLGYCDNNNNNYIFNISCSNLTILKEHVTNFNTYYSNIQLSISKQSNIYQAILYGTNIKSFINKWKHMFYYSNNKKVPQCILNSDIYSIKEFIKGYKQTIPNKSNKIHCTNSLSTQGLYILLTLLGYNVLLENTKNNKYSLIYSKSNNKTILKTQVKQIISLGYIDDYVYDIETENHHFSAGIGKLVVHNTDSVMVKFGTDDVNEGMNLGREAAEYVTSHFVRPINLEFEKVYFPYLLMSKKRYAGLLWTKPDKFDKMDAKGIVTVRRDNCPLVKEVIDTSLRKILIERDPKGAEEYVKGMISDLLQNKVDLALLVITKALSKNEYKNKQAHVELTNRMHARDPGSAPNVGDRVPYVIVKGTKDARAYEKAEDPLWALENGIPLDNQYYLDHQLSKPLKAIFTPILGSVNKLLSGDHTLKVAQTASASNPLSGFLKRSVRCMNCRVIVPSGKTLCNHCKELNIEGQIYQEKLSLVNDLELKFSRLWTQCQSCQGSFHQPVLCTSRDCPIFYMRSKVRKDLQEAQEKLSRFKIDW